MPQFITDFQKRIVEFWKSLDKKQKNRIYITTAIVTVSVILGMIYLLKPNYIVIVKSDDLNELNEMRLILNENGIKHKVEGNSNILVDAKDKNKAELALAVEGYPKGGMKFEDAWNQIKINTTESDKKKLWEEYKKNSLIAKLKMFSNIKDADVDLSIPEPSLFAKEQRPTAYVRVTPKEKLTPEQVDGIIMVVSRSVENLQPEDITVVDNYANILSGTNGKGLETEITTQEQLRQQKATELERKVYNLFNMPSDFCDNIKVAVNPVIDFTKQKSQTQAIEKPQGMDEGYIVTRETSSETVRNAAAAGEPGLGTNPGTEDPATYQTGQGNDSAYSKKTSSEYFEYTRTTTDTEKAVGVYDPQNSTMTVTLWYGQVVKDDSKLTDELINGIKADVSKATGIPVENISVNKYKLTEPQEVQPEFAEKLKEFLDDYGFFILMLALIAGLIITIIPSRLRNKVPEADLQELAAAGGPDINMIEEKEVIEEISIEEKSEFKKQIDRFVKQKPDVVAQLLRSWLSDDWE